LSIAVLLLFITLSPLLLLLLLLLKLILHSHSGSLLGSSGSRAVRRGSRISVHILGDVSARQLPEEPERVVHQHIVPLPPLALAQHKGLDEGAVFGDDVVAGEGDAPGYCDQDRGGGGGGNVLAVNAVIWFVVCGWCDRGDWVIVFDRDRDRDRGRVVIVVHF